MKTDTLSKCFVETAALIQELRQAIREKRSNQNLMVLAAQLDWKKDWLGHEVGKVVDHHREARKQLACHLAEKK